MVPSIQSQLANQISRLEKVLCLFSVLLSLRLCDYNRHYSCSSSANPSHPRPSHTTPYIAFASSCRLKKLHHRRSIHPVIDGRLHRKSTSWLDLPIPPSIALRTDSAVRPTSSGHKCYLKLAASAYQHPGGATDNCSWFSTMSCWEAHRHVLSFILHSWAADRPSQVIEYFLRHSSSRIVNSDHSQILQTSNDGF